MNILHVNMSLDSVAGGGTVERTLQLHRALQGLGVESHILTVNSTDNARKNEVQNDVTALPSLSNRWYIPFPTIRIVRELVKKADVIHLMNHWTFINAWVYLLAKTHGKPYVICPAGSLTIFGRSQAKKRLYQRVIGKQILRHAAAAIAISTHEVAQFENLGIRPDAIEHIPNGVSESDFSCHDESGFRNQFDIGPAPYILFVGRLNAIKGPDLLLEAFIQLKDKFSYHLVFAGPDGGMKAQLEQRILVEELSNRVHFPGYLGGKVKSSAYHGAEFLVIPSRHEAMSIVALEAAICHKPVLLTDQCGFSSLEKAGGGVEVPATIEGLTKGLIQIAGENIYLMDMGERAHAFASENYSWSVTAKHFTELANKVG